MLSGASKVNSTFKALACLLLIVIHFLLCCSVFLRLFHSEAWHRGPASSIFSFYQTLLLNDGARAGLGNAEGKSGAKVIGSSVSVVSMSVGRKWEKEIHFEISQLDPCLGGDTKFRFCSLKLF